jgi:AcrR family transcriptional regulator
LTSRVASVIVPGNIRYRMASPAPAKSAPLQPDDWIRAAFVRISSEGVDSVRIEVLARDMAVSKGSFYWHFTDREDLLAKLLARWAEGEMEWLDRAMAENESAALRWALFVERTSDANRARLEVAMRNWARRDHAAASHLTAIEHKQARFIAGVLQDTGFARAAAEYWAEIVQLACLGWMDRTTRGVESQLPGATLGEFLSELILAASARSSALNH